MLLLDGCGADASLLLIHGSSAAEKGVAMNTELAPNSHCHPSERIEGESDALETD